LSLVGVPPPKDNQTNSTNIRIIEYSLQAALHLELHQNNLFFRFENSLRKSDALIFRRSCSLRRKFGNKGGAYGFAPSSPPL